jgi:hypothetical protein
VQAIIAQGYITYEVKQSHSECHGCRSLRGRQRVSDERFAFIIVYLGIIRYIYMLFTCDTVSGSDYTAPKSKMISGGGRCGWKP